jgi:protease PrsW
MDKLLIFLAIFVTGGLWLKILYKYDKVEPEPIFVVLKILILGGILSAIPASILNLIAEGITGFKTGAQNSLFSAGFFSFAVGFNEEICKALATVLLTMGLSELDEPIDAVIYSTAVGLGFAVVENFQYGFQYGLFNLGLRSITAMPLHIGLAVLWGTSIAKVRFFPGSSYFEQMRKPVLQAAIIHGVYDFILFYFQIPLLGLATSIAFAFILIQMAHKELIYLQGQTPFLPAGICTNCGTENSPGAKTCVSCNFNLEQNFFIVCSDCGTKLPSDFTSCSSCGAQVSPKFLFQEKFP